MFVLAKPDLSASRARRSGRVLVAATVVASLLALAGCATSPDDAATEDDLAFLRSTASEWQSAPLEEGTLFVRDETSGRCAAGIVVDGSRRVWILLDHDTKVLRVPDEPVSMPDGELSMVSGFCEPSEIVRESLDRPLDEP